MSPHGQWLESPSSEPWVLAFISFSKVHSITHSHFKTSLIIQACLSLFHRVPRVLCVEKNSTAFTRCFRDLTSLWVLLLGPHCNLIKGQSHFPLAVCCWVHCGYSEGFVDSGWNEKMTSIAAESRPTAFSGKSNASSSEKPVYASRGSPKCQLICHRPRDRRALRDLGPNQIT